MIEMKPAKELTGDGFWSNRENYPVWDRTLRMLYDIADMVSESEPGRCASRLSVA